MLDVIDLSCSRGGQAVLENVSFSLKAGEALVLRGPNGAGKTTLLRVLAGLQSPTSGTIEMPEGEAAYASHADGIKAQLSVRENLAFWAALYEQPLEAQVFEDFNLTELIERPAATLSAGQKRRLGLARLGVIGRKILFLDEPTVSLDTASVALFGTWVRERHLARGGIAVMATHIDLGLEAQSLDIASYRARLDAPGAASDEAFL